MCFECFHVYALKKEGNGRYILIAYILVVENSKLCMAKSIGAKKISIVPRFSPLRHFTVLKIVRRSLNSFSVLQISAIGSVCCK